MASHWMPEDDLRLRKSIEEGASLESLAKGAIKFSRKFTLSELKDRWHSLLYNPEVTSLSSSSGFDLQYSSQFYQQRLPHYTTQVRSQYYTSRKRKRFDHEPFNFDINDYFFSGLRPEEVEHIHNSFQLNHDQQDDFYHVDNDGNDGYDDDDDALLMNQLLNIDGQIQDSIGLDTTTTTTEHGLVQEEFQEPLFQQPNTSQSHHQILIPDQAETLIVPESSQDLPIKSKGFCHKAMLLSIMDPHPESKNGVIICSLNRQVEEIPNNDDIVLQIRNSRLRNSVNSSSSSLRKYMKPPLPSIRGSSSLQANGNNDNIQSSGFVDCTVTTTQASCSSSAFKDSFTENPTTSTVVAAPTSSSSLQQQSPEIGICEEILTTEMNINTSMSEAEDHNNEIESDEDLPSFSDVEAMVLDMDLEPLGQDRYEFEALRYRNDEMVRMIMRLELSSDSYMNRDMASHGAFALLYGSSKHYITKPEVLLGRATGEYPVDIDLGKSGSETRVSRRQAIIRLKQDGCFEFKNLGKFSIWINEKEIEHGEVVNLKKNSLIQIREMSFIFETNEKAVKRYLDGIRV